MARGVSILILCSWFYKFMVFFSHDCEFDLHAQNFDSIVLRWRCKFLLISFNQKLASVCGLSKACYCCPIWIAWIDLCTSIESQRGLCVCVILNEHYDDASMHTYTLLWFHKHHHPIIICIQWIITLYFNCPISRQTYLSCKQELYTILLLLYLGPNLHESSLDVVEWWNN